MTESIVTMSIAGLIAGFIFSMPIAGPISILITTNALKGKFRYCNLVNIGASFATFTYVFFAVFGLSKLYRFYKPAIPYLFTAGSIFLIFIGYRIFKTKFDIEHIGDKTLTNKSAKNKTTGGFFTGLVINFLNPTLFLGWLTSTFLVLTFLTSIGLYTGGLNKFVVQNVKETQSVRTVQQTDDDLLLPENSVNEAHNDIENSVEKEKSLPSNFHFLISIIYAAGISLGSVIWFYILALSITKFRKYINFKYVTTFIKSMGIVLCIIGLYFGYLGAIEFSR